MPALGEIILTAADPGNPPAPSRSPSRHKDNHARRCRRWGSTGRCRDRLDFQSLKKGDRLKVGQCIIEVTNVRIPCASLKKWDPDLPELIVGFSGWVAKVIEGQVKTGDNIEKT
jgi:hypothetical protein